MKRIISKQVIATWGQPGFLEQNFFDSVYDKVMNHDRRYKTKDEYNKPKKTTLTYTPGLGTTDRAGNPGAGSSLDRDENEHNNKSVGSGYNDGNRADDEIGPGHRTPIFQTDENQNPYYGSDVYNELFLDIGLRNPERTDAIRKHHKQVMYGPTVNPPRYPVK